MNFCGIISEFNPFHNGHEYIIHEAKKITGLDVLCLMSGNFVQRGEPAIQNKYERAKNAIDSGAAAVLELPVVYACSNAENFAAGAIRILAALKVTHLAFGIENTNLETLQKIAKLKYENSEKFNNAFKNEIQNGISYNTALKRAIAKNINEKNIEEILNKPNNILAIEYLTAMLKQNANITPIAIERCDNGYYSNEEKNKFLSASAIRQKLELQENIDDYIPKNAKINKFLSKNQQKTLNMLQIYEIRKMLAEELEKFYDYSEGIEYRIKSAANANDSYEKITNNIITPRYRTQRVNKLLLYPLLHITKTIVKNSFETKPVVKVLALRKTHKSLLSEFDKDKINLIATNKDYNTLSEAQLEQINIDLNASMIYETIAEDNPNSDKKIGTMFL